MEGTMFSLLPFFKKKKRIETVAEVLDYTVAEDAFETLVGSKNIKPVRCAPVLNLPYSSSQSEPVTIRLVQGSSDSKSAKRETRTRSQPLKKSSSTEARYSVSNVTSLKQEAVSVPQFHEASSLRAEQSLSTAAARLYPDLKSTGTKECSQNVRTDPWTLSKNKEKSIHDIADEIKCEVQQRIIFSSVIKKNFQQFKSNAIKDVTIMMSMLTNSSKLDYNFDKELKVQSEYSHVTKYIKLQSFKDVQKHHEKLNKPTKRQRDDPAFPSYFRKLRCYKGKKSDVVDCD